MLHVRTMMTVLVRESEESLFGGLWCKLEDKNKMDCTRVGKEGMDWVRMD